MLAWMFSATVHAIYCHIDETELLYVLVGNTKPWEVEEERLLVICVPGFPHSAACSEARLRNEVV